MNSEPSIEALVDLYLDRLHLGDPPDIERFAAEHPSRSAELLEILPLLDDLEHLGNAGRGKPFAEPSSIIPELTGADFKLVRKIGGGGMGVVYEARQISLNRPVAVKLLAPSLVSSRRHREQFEYESRTVAMLHHPNIVKIIAAGQAAGSCFYAMELIDGTRLDKHEFASLREIAAAGLQTANALAYAHSCKIVHRDIKPSNLLIDREGSVHIADFGLVVLLNDGVTTAVRPGAQNGTLRYMPPERLMYGRNSFSGDQYALGVTLCELITRRPILEERSSAALFKRICQKPLPPLSGVHPDLAAIINKSISFDQKKRYPSMQAFADDLRRFLAGEPVAANPPSLLRRLALWTRRKPAYAIAASLAAAVTVFLAAALVRDNLRSNAFLHIAERNAAMADAALTRIFENMDSMPPTKRNAELLYSLIPYYVELFNRGDLPREKLARAARTLGICAFYAGNYPLTEKAIRRFLSIRSTPRAINLLAETLRRQGNFSEADSLNRQVAEKYAASADPAERFAAVTALNVLAGPSPNDPNRIRAYRIVADLLRHHPSNSEFLFGYASMIGECPSLVSLETIPGISSDAGKILYNLALHEPERPKYALALIELAINRLNRDCRHTPEDHDRFSKVLNVADRTFGRYPNIPDVASSVLRFRGEWVNHLRLRGEIALADDEAIRTASMAEMLCENNELPVAARLQFSTPSGQILPYRQIVANRRKAGPFSLVAILHGPEGAGSDNSRQLAAPSLSTIVNYVQTSGAKAVIILPQTQNPEGWQASITPTLSALIAEKRREFRISPDAVRTVSGNLSHPACPSLFKP